MVDWSMLSPMLFAAVIEWAGAAVTLLAVGKWNSNGER
jgi:hypothetical protein